MSIPPPAVYTCPEVRQVARLYHDLLSDESRRLAVREQLDRQARRLFEAHRSGDTAVVTQITCWHPELVGQTSAVIMSREFTFEDARQTIAREYGFADWPDVERRGADPPDRDFESAVDALLAGDVARLRELLERVPSLVQARSSFGHRSTLLHYVGSNGVETYRQKVPQNLAEVTRVLIEAGADVNATARMYGGGCTALALVTSSAHPAEAGVMDEVVATLLAGETGGDRASGR